MAEPHRATDDRSTEDASRPASPPRAATSSEIGAALGCFALLVVVIAAPAILGFTTLGPDRMLDHDLVYRRSAAPGG